MINLIIVDDHQLFIDGVKTVLADVPDINIIGEALNGEHLLDLLKTKQADVVLLDINMPIMDGLEAASIIKEKHNKTKTIILSQYNDKGLVKKAKEYGCSGYLLKDCDKTELVTAIETVYAGGLFYNPKNGVKTSFGNLGFNTGNVDLTKKENETLRLILDEKSNKEIAKEMEISINTVRTNKERLHCKTGNTTMAGLIKWALENNIL